MGSAGDEDWGSEDLERRRVWLVGMMGVGKSTVGLLLARRLGLPFIDTDREVERCAGRTIAEIFATRGEPAFRQLEAAAIDAAAKQCAVVALGGGAFAQPGAAERLRKEGIVVYLKATPAQLLRRIGKPESRPLLQGLSQEQREARLGALLAEREGAYCRAQITVDAGAASFEAVAKELADRLVAREGARQ